MGSRRKHRKNRVAYTRAGPVKVISPNGKVQVRPALSPKEYRKAVREGSYELGT